MGVGKTATASALNQLLPNSVFLDGDQCWNMSPFTVTDETKAMVLDNITHLLNNFIRCSAFQHIVFCWVMHQQTIIEDILTRLDLSRCRFHLFTLECSDAALLQRLQLDIQAGVRQPGVAERSLAYAKLYPSMRSTHIDVSNISPKQAAELISRQL